MLLAPPILNPSKIKIDFINILTHVKVSNIFREQPLWNCQVDPVEKRRSEAGSEKYSPSFVLFMLVKLVSTKGETIVLQPSAFLDKEKFHFSKLFTPSIKAGTLCETLRGTNEQFQKFKDKIIQMFFSSSLYFILYFYNSSICLNFMTLHFLVN